jgi:hypothetical protein
MAELLYEKPLNYVRLSKDTGIGISRLRNVLDAHAQRSGETRATGKSKDRARVITLLDPRRTVTDAAKLAKEG